RNILARIADRHDEAHARLGQIRRWGWDRRGTAHQLNSRTVEGWIARRTSQRDGQHLAAGIDGEADGRDADASGPAGIALVAVEVGVDAGLPARRRHSRTG